MRIGVLLMAAFLAACSARFPTSDREAAHTYNEGTFGREPTQEESNTSVSSEIESLRQESAELDRRISGARMRDDNPGFRTSPFPSGSAVDMGAMRERKSQVEQRIADLEAQAQATDDQVQDSRAKRAKKRGE